MFTGGVISVRVRPLRGRIISLAPFFALSKIIAQAEAKI